MSQVEAPVISVTLISDHPDCPEGKHAVAVVFSLDPAQFAPIWTHVQSSQNALHMRLGFDELADPRDKLIANLEAALKSARADALKYKAALEMPGQIDGGRFSLLEIT
jgi:hypothetical protein